MENSKVNSKGESRSSKAVANVVNIQNEPASEMRMPEAAISQSSDFDKISGDRQGLAPFAETQKTGNLPDHIQAKMERSFGQDFSDVEIHKNSDDAKELNALAFTQGNHIHFKSGEFDAFSQKGQELIAHELSHVVQQRKGIVTGTHKENGYSVNTDETLEKEADMTGRGAVNGDRITSFGSERYNSISQNYDNPIQLRRILPSGAPLAELSIDSTSVIRAFESLWSRRPASYRSEWLFDTPDRFSDHPELPDSVREVCGGDYFRGNSYWSSGWVDDGDDDILWAGDADIKAEMTVYIDNERTGGTRTGTFGSTSSTTRERSQQSQATTGIKVKGGGEQGSVEMSGQNQETRTNSMTVAGGSSLSMEIPSTTIRADVVMFLKLSFRPSVYSAFVKLEYVEGYTSIVGSLLLGAPRE